MIKVKKSVFVLFITIIMVLSSLQPVVYASTLYEYYNTNGDNYDTIYAQYWRAQSFTIGVTGHTITSVKLLMARYGNPGTLTLSIMETDVNGKPTGADKTVGTINANTFSADPTFNWYEISLTEYTLTANTKYVIVIRAISGTSSNSVYWKIDSTGPTYTGGSWMYSQNSGSTWTLYTDYDTMFEIYGGLPPVSITITSSPTGSGYVLVDGSAISTPQIYSWAVGATHVITANSPANLVNGESQYVYTSWSDAGTQSHTYTVSVDATVTASFQLQYYLTVTGGSSPTGQGWYNNGVNTNPTNLWVWSVLNTSRIVLTNWQLDSTNQNPARLNTGTFTTPNITMSTYHTVNFISTIQYYNDLSSAVISLPTTQSGSQLNDDWYDSGTNSTVSLTSPTIQGDIIFTFKNWYWKRGNILQSNSTLNPFKIIMSNYTECVAYWSVSGADSNGSFSSGLFVGLFITVMVIVLLLATRRR